MTYVIGEDTDLLVLLCHHGEAGMNDLYFKSSKVGEKCWHISSVMETLGGKCWHINSVMGTLGTSV